MARPLSLGLPSFTVGMALGGVLLAAAISIAAAALSNLRSHRTTNEPGQVPTALVTTGVFRLSRNPLYLSLVLVMASIASMADSVWLAASAVLLALALDRVIIRAEERVLEQEFGRAWLEYRSRVRRWL